MLSMDEILKQKYRDMIDLGSIYSISKSPLKGMYPITSLGV